MASDVEQSIPAFSIDALLQAAKIPANKLPSIKAFLVWANLDETTIDALSEESLEKLKKKYKAEIEKEFTLGFYALTILQAASHWTKAKEKPPQVLNTPSNDNNKDVLQEFIWDGHANVVFLKGSWDWRVQYPMKKIGTDFRYSLWLPKQIFEYGFEVDGKWTIDYHQPVTRTDGKINNLIDLRHRDDEDFKKQVEELTIETHRMALLGIRSLSHEAVYHQISSQFAGFTLNFAETVSGLPTLSKAAVQELWTEISGKIKLPQPDAEEAAYQARVENLFTLVQKSLLSRDKEKSTCHLHFQKPLIDPHVEEDVVLSATKACNSHQAVVAVCEVESRKDGTKSNVSKLKEGIGQAISYLASSLIHRTQSMYGYAFFTDLVSIAVVKVQVTPPGKTEKLIFCETGLLPLITPGEKIPTVGFEVLCRILFASPQELGYVHPQVTTCRNKMNAEIKLGDYLGIGAFSIVYEVKDRPNTVAKLPIPGSTTDYTKEISILSKVAGKFLVLHDDSSEKAIFLSPLGRPIGAVMASNKGKLPLDSAIKYIKDLLKHLDYAHKQDVFHRDVRPSNIIVDDEGNAVLIDWGSAVEGSTQDLFLASDDLESLAYTFYFLLHGELPWRKAASVQELIDSRDKLRNTKTDDVEIQFLQKSCEKHTTASILLSFLGALWTA